MIVAERPQTKRTTNCHTSMQRLCTVIFSLLFVSAAACSHPNTPAEPVIRATAGLGALAAASPVAAPSVYQAAPYATPPATLADAQAALSFPLQVPAAIPAGYELAAISVCCGQGSAASVALTYRAASGRDILGDLPEFTFLQGPMFIHLPAPDSDPMFACMSGTTTVQGRPAVWQRQQCVFNLPQDVCQPAYASRAPILQLDWLAAGDGPAIGYQVQSVSLGLDQLVAIANSLQPYSGP